MILDYLLFRIVKDPVTGDYIICMPILLAATYVK